MVSLIRVTRLRLLVAGFSLSVLAACGEKSAPWNTYPGLDGHAAYLPLRGTAHDPVGLASATSCEGCHPGTTFRSFTCTGCHTAALTDPIHATSLVPGYVAGAVTSADCYRCHPTGAGIAPATHGLYFPIGTAAHPAVCRLCHTDPTARTDPDRLACVSCHEARAGFAAVHALSRVPDYPAAPSSKWCLRCHASGQVDRIAAHGRRTAPGGDRDGGGPGDGNHGMHCFSCHTMVPPLFGGAGAGVRDRPWAQDWGQAGCTPCH